MALKVSRIALLASVVLYAAILALGLAKIGEPLTLYVIGIYSGLAVGVSALACVVLQLFVWVRRTPHRTN